MSWQPQIKRRSSADVITDEAEFLASEFFTVKRGGATFDHTTVDANGDGDRILRKGTVVAALDTGKYGLYDNGGSGGAEIAVGFSMESHNVRDGDAILGVVISGSVIADRCSGLDANAKTDLANHFTFQ
jgi:hypothetical protein